MTFKTDAVAYIGDADTFFGQQYPGCLQPYLCKVLMRRLLIDTGEKPVKMEPGEKGLPGYLVQVDGRVIVFVNEDLCCGKPLVYVRGKLHCMLI